MDDARYIILPGDIRNDTRLTLAHLRVAMVLGAYSKRQGWTDLTQSEVGEMAGLARQTVNECVAELVEWGWVARRKKDKKNQYIYRFIMDRDEYCQPQTTVPQDCQPQVTVHCQPQPTSTVASDPTIHKEASSSYSSQVIARGDALATQSAARPAPVQRAIRVAAGEACFAEWLSAIEERSGDAARAAAESLGELFVHDRWPKPDSPLPRIPTIRNPAGGN